MFMFCFLFLFDLLKAEKKHYEKETEKYYSSLEKLLNLSAKKKEPQLQEVFSFTDLSRSSTCRDETYNDYKAERQWHLV